MKIVDLRNRIHYLQFICESLQDTTSLIIKQQIVNDIEPECRDDFNFILEILAGKHKLGYSYYRRESLDIMPMSVMQKSFKEYLQPLWDPLTKHDLSVASIETAMSQVRWHTTFVASIVNRTLRLGIGPSLLPKDGLSAMLAKKYEGKIKSDDTGYFVTEKLDGNRCIAHYDGSKWNFTSRNGKPMNVNFNMGNLPTDRVYDGEVLSIAQTECSKAIAKGVYIEQHGGTSAFQSTSGLINRKGEKKGLVYNIFDIMCDNAPYFERRTELEYIAKAELNSNDIRILPILKRYNTAAELREGIDKLLVDVTCAGAEGLMINTGFGKYQHQRTDDLLKYKNVQTMDMKVIDWEYGNGKYEFSLGYLICYGKAPNGKEISCRVGTGISDAQRSTWSGNPELIVGKIVEVAYFDISHNNTGVYSLRFPRLKGVREDKTEVSPY